ncbi:hypothetical protein [Streptomyces sp. NBC_00503]|uniref:hypothetical protein n=1 Tax=Streptomyces sp. NBC_00503 TaxID=2903659 RepID=UPI002E801258|nr:hypothetical protein [Streptomyces sp. NBC_00503]WUD83337.1 hypothetical protein OG490_23835 [Streptomyces sp. NBC_00503]
MDDQQAVARAEELVQQALAVMSPKPTPKQDGRYGAGTCLADSGSTDRHQVHISYDFKEVPGSAGRQLVRQVRDAWVALGYKFQDGTSDGDWSDPGATVHMRTASDDYWMTMGNSVTNETTGEGVAYIIVTSPCYVPKTADGSPSPSAQGLSSVTADEASEQRVLAHSSRIYDALRVPHSATAGAQLRTVEDGGATYVHHAWATEPLAADRAARAFERTREYLTGADWRVRTAPGRLVALHPADEVTAQLVSAPDGALQIGVTGPAVPVLRTEA